MTIATLPESGSSKEQSSSANARAPSPPPGAAPRYGRTEDVAHERVAWVDYAKGFCIVFVVMMHSTLGVESALGHEGFMHHVVAFAKPFRMPDFFLISGLFLSRVIARGWRTYLDRKVAHFAYFYVLWLTIQFAFKAPALVVDSGVGGAIHQYMMAFVEPFGTLWFIYMLPVFFVTTKLLRDVLQARIWAAAAILEISHIDSGWLVIDEFASRYVYFFSGYVLAPHIFAFARGVQSQPIFGIAGLLLWSLVNGLAVAWGYAQTPFISLGLGLSGAAAVVTVSALMAKSKFFEPLRYCGRHSIVIYLAFFLPMAATRTLLIRSAIISDIGVASLVVTFAGIVGALLLFWLARARGWLFLFERPAKFRLLPTPDPSNFIGV